jgi:CRP-like cAMP-binding protein
MRRRGRLHWDLVPNLLLAAIPRAEHEQLAPHLETVPLEPRRFFLPAGERMSHVYFPHAGVVSLVVSMHTGASVEVASVGREGMLGVSVVLEADPPPYDMVCQLRGQAARLRPAVFLDAVKELPMLRQVVLRYTLALINQLARTAACNRLHSVEQRLARWLLLCRDRAAGDDLGLTHELLARMLGTGRPFVTQTAQSLQEAGLIEYRRGRIRIIDRPGLEAAACEDYRATTDEYRRLLGVAP